MDEFARAGRIGVGIDIGGTSIKAARVWKDGSASAPARRSTPTDRRENLIAAIVEMIREQTSGGAPEEGFVVGVGTPGYGGEDGFIIGGAHNLPDWRGFNLAKEISARVSYPVYINNDASMAAFGEYSKYYAESVENMAYLGFGTGVGGGIVLRGKLYEGVRGLGTELGHIVVDPDGRPCACGRRGCLETWASRKGMMTAAKAILDGAREETPFSRAFIDSDDEMTPVEIFSFVKRGDPLAVELFSGLCDAVARACDTLAAILAPEVIVLGGGIMNAGGFILEEVRKRFARYCLSDFLPHVSIEMARCGENAGVIGAGMYALSRAEGEGL